MATGHEGLLPQKRQKLTQADPLDQPGPSSDSLPHSSDDPPPVTQRYEYSTLQDVLNMYPLQEKSKVVNVYGIIVEYDESTHELIIKDETTERFTLILNARETAPGTEEPRELPLVAGDIIRIHRLTLYQDLQRRCPRIHNVVTFNPFQKKVFKFPTYLAKKATFEDHDSERVEALTKWISEQLLRPHVTQVPGKDFVLVDASFIVLVVEKMGNERTVLVCINGRPLTQYPCASLFTKEYVMKTWDNLVQTRQGQFCMSIHNYVPKDIERLYDDKGIFFISAYGSQAFEAAKLKPLDMIAALNVLIKAEDMVPNCYSYVLYSGNTHGRAIRRCEPRSSLANILEKQIHAYSCIVEMPDFETEDYDVLRSRVHIFDDSDATDMDSELGSDEEEAMVGRYEVHFENDDEDKENRNINEEEREEGEEGNEEEGS